MLDNTAAKEIYPVQDKEPSKPPITIRQENGLQPVTTLDSLLNLTQIETEQNNALATVPEDWHWMKELFSSFTKSGVETMKEYYGLSENSTEYRVFHGTKRSKLLDIIASDGMIGFPEPGVTQGIYVTSSPTRAVWHGEYNGPHDKLRKEGKAEDIRHEETVLLLIRFSKEELEKNPDVRRPGLLPQWLKEAHGIVGEEDMRIENFKSAITEEIRELASGKEANDFGFKLPIDKVSLDNIYVVDKNTHSIEPIE